MMFATPVRHREPSRNSRSARIRALLAVGTAVGIGTVLTLAAWTDSGSVSGTFSTGSVDIKLDGVDTAPTVASLALSNARPGDVTYAPLEVTNEGTIDFTYAITPSIATASTSTPLLESVLLVSVRVVDSVCNETTFAASSDTVLAERALNVATATSSRPLEATTGAEVLCFMVELPSDASSAVQSQTTTATFTFVATQAS